MKKETLSADRKNLRRLAEKKLEQTQDQGDLSKKSPEDMASLIHELRVHQIELEMQNEELQRIHQALEQTKNQYAHLYDFSPLGYLSVSEKGIIEKANLTIATMLKKTRGELIGKPLSHFVHKDDQDILYKHRARLLKTQAPQMCDLRLSADAGPEFYARLDCLIIKTRDDGIEEIRVAVSDVTEIRQAENELRERRQKYMSMVENIEIGVSLISPRMEVLELNRKMREWFPDADAETKPVCYKVFHDPPGDTVCDWCPTVKTLQDGKVHESKTDTPTANGIRNYRIVSSPIVDSTGEIVATIEMVDDITEQLALENQLRQAQKMESVGNLAGGIAHDFNNMLGVILGRTELALLKTDETHDLYADLKEIQAAAARSAEITKKLLAFARKQTISPRQLDLNDTVESILNTLRRLIGEDIDLVWQPCSFLWPVKMDPTQIDQILANLCVNARDAISGVGKLTIETGRKSFDEEYCKQHAGFTPGDFVLLAVSDNGCGMDKDTLDNLFEPFFTTKEVGKGTGLGLATVYGIVKQNNGFINVYSEPGRGSTFRIYLPRLVGDEDTDTVVPEKKAAAGGTETVLLVEDEQSILRMTRMMLEKKGYTVLSSATPAEAMEKAKNLSGAIDLLITDVVMPEMNGRDLAGKMTALYPDIRLLFMSGYTANVIAHRGVLDDGVAFIQKPFSMTDLMVKVREVLDKQPGETHV